MKFKAKKFESICKEFAKKIYNMMDAEDRAYVQEESFLMLRTYEKLFDEYAYPALEIAAATYPNDYQKSLKKYPLLGEEHSILYNGSGMVEQCLEELHK
ncbi:hypothetical protein [Paenibacillus glucanolyticus]|uniref:hypothetical protein n=1 Tax=Paenibacillus glucanolyticus TaxID=59843 RepID=UPI00096DC3BC|nr:hypothetical protein [Paenibacillus glucanolyticus]OMF76696.1 hypothetical protein BK142_14335 [Paenibacillus glucanolyticus]